MIYPKYDETKHTFNQSITVLPCVDSMNELYGLQNTGLSQLYDSCVRYCLEDNILYVYLYDSEFESYIWVNISTISTTLFGGKEGIGLN